jgi:hypothetical protein
MKKILIIAALFGTFALPATAQKRKPLAKIASAVFAVLNDGKIVEPIAKIERGMLLPISDGADEDAKLVKFVGDYYKVGTKYKLVFGGANAGVVSITKSLRDTECMRNQAQAGVVSTRAKLKGMVMGLATNAAVKGSGVRRLPTAAERTEIEALVRGEFGKNGITASILKNLKYHNLTALDLDSDGKAELVGSYWVEPAAKERALLFFIAEIAADGKYAIGIGEFKTVKEEEVMSGEIKHLDDGVYHELLLDALDINADGAAEVFTYVQSFEGSGFNAYSRKNGKWERIFDGSNYHCGY